VIRVEGGFVLLLLALDVFCVIDLIQTPEGEVRNLPKVAWLFLILLFPPIGAIAWLAAGRPQRAAGPRSAYGGALPAYPESDEEFLRRVRERAEEQRRKAAEEKRRREAEEGDSS
jgi:hypothetical protein